jgi:hypothetical protein
MNINSESKYGDDEKFEPWADINIFFPIATKLVDPLYNLGLTPNMVTILSTIFTFLSIYFLYLDKRIHAIISYLIGYTLDCVDGKMARKYNMGSEFGMILDSTSDNISNLTLLAFLIFSRQFTLKFIIQLLGLLIFIYLQAAYYGLNEAIVLYKETNSDNIYEHRKKQFENKGCGIEYILNQIFILITKFSYTSYRSFIKTYNEETTNSKLQFLKLFGPGNLILFNVGILLFI